MSVFTRHLTDLQGTLRLRSVSVCYFVLQPHILSQPFPPTAVHAFMGFPTISAIIFSTRCVFCKTLFCPPFTRILPFLSARIQTFAASVFIYKALLWGCIPATHCSQELNGRCCVIIIYAACFAASAFIQRLTADRIFKAIRNFSAPWLPYSRKGYPEQTGSKACYVGNFAA